MSSRIISQAVIDRALGRKPILTAQMIAVKRDRDKCKPKVSEADIQRACTNLLIADGWRAIRTDPVSDRKRGKGFGEMGMPDYLYIRYGSAEPVPLDYLAAGEILWVEYKRPGIKLRANQAHWHAKERGALVWVVDDIDEFREKYAASGLARGVR